MNHKIEFYETSLKDLDEIYNYVLLNSFDIVTARNFVLDIVDYCKILNDNPLLGKELYLLEEKTKYRYLVYKKYLIFYVLKDKIPNIYRIINSRRDYIKILFEDIIDN